MTVARMHHREAKQRADFMALSSLARLLYDCFSGYIHLFRNVILAKDRGACLMDPRFWQPNIDRISRLIN